ncbi:hypothetical protein F4678DRAFT_461426 [Xylaria arbuscula]|nr:hypothetical protein F4678DRAFT_461426 [Xylaria arbuscula]
MEDGNVGLWDMGEWYLYIGVGPAAMTAGQGTTAPLASRLPLSSIPCAMVGSALQPSLAAHHDAKDEQAGGDSGFGQSQQRLPILVVPGGSGANKTESAALEAIRRRVKLISGPEMSCSALDVLHAGDGQDSAHSSTLWPEKTTTWQACCRK